MRHLNIFLLCCFTKNIEINNNTYGWIYLFSKLTGSFSRKRRKNRQTTYKTKHIFFNRLTFWLPIICAPKNNLFQLYRMIVFFFYQDTQREIWNRLILRTITISFRLIWFYALSTIVDYILSKSFLYIYIFTNPFARVGYDIRSIFKRSLTGLNSEFSFS